MKLQYWDGEWKSFDNLLRPGRYYKQFKKEADMNKHMTWADDYLRKYGEAVVKFGLSASLVYDFDTETFSLKKEAEGMREDVGMKKDTCMKKQMNEATIQALHKSIAHWNDICYGMEDNVSPSKCALCQKFGSPGGDCGGCPISTNSVKCYNKFSVYASYTTLRTDEGFCTVDSADAAEAMLELLVSLLPDVRPNSEQERYGAYLPSLPKDEYFVGGIEWYEFTGITTDGRNAFPQAKYVWEKVFEYQVCGPIPVSPSYEWVADLPRASFIWSWPEAKTKDGKCVTCGQVVKKKVTKYKAVCKSHPDADVRISCEYYESEEDFNRRCDLTLFVSLIKETAKEFDV